MACKRSEQCTHGKLCKYANSEAYDILGGSCYKPKKPMTNAEYIRSCSVEELAGIIYEWHTKGYTKGEIGFPLKSIMEVVEWLKQPHTIKE